MATMTRLNFNIGPYGKNVEKSSPLKPVSQFKAKCYSTKCITLSIWTTRKDFLSTAMKIYDILLQVNMLLVTEASWTLFLSFIDLRILITPLISSNSSYDNDCVSGDHVAHLFVFCVLFLHFVCSVIVIEKSWICIKLCVTHDKNK
jgi:hypothetical protein